MKKINNFSDVASWRMCIGCGACVSACPENAIRMRNIETDGLRPLAVGNDCRNCQSCLGVCPGMHLNNDTQHPAEIPQLRQGWGTVLALYHGYAVDERIRHNGSSGGVATALALYCIERGGMHGAIHTRADTEAPWLNATTYSTTAQEIIGAAGSRYSPASPCDRVREYTSTHERSVFIGKPCDIAGVYRLRKRSAQVDAGIGCTIGIFCAGTPSTYGTLKLFEELGIKRGEIAELRYRGRGWPGKFSVRFKNDAAWHEYMTYRDSWGFIQKYRPLRCYQCPDGTSEFADISCGDSWDKKDEGDQPGISLVLARTARGRQIIEDAVKTGYVSLNPAASDSLEKAQQNLLDKRSWISGRLMALRVMGIPAPHFKGFSLGRLWLRAPINEKARSIVGTLRRAAQRKYWKPIQIPESEFSIE